MSARPVVVTATTAAAVTAVAALMMLGAAVVFGLDGLTRPGLICLFAVPVVRNLVVIAGGRGSVRGSVRALAVVGVVLVLVVGVVAFGRQSTLDRATPALPTSTP